MGWLREMEELRVEVAQALGSRSLSPPANAAIVLPTGPHAGERNCDGRVGGPRCSKSTIFARPTASSVAVDGVSFTAEKGSIFGLLGPNGAGKSTTIGCISGLLQPTGGRIAVLGHDVITDGLAARQKLGIVPQELALYTELSATDNLSYWGGAYGLRGHELKERVAAVLELTGLLDRAKEPVKRLSGGMQRRLNFGCGIVHEPEVLLLDEPTVGIDPQSRVRLIELVGVKSAAAGTCACSTRPTTWRRPRSSATGSAIVDQRQDDRDRHARRAAGDDRRARPPAARGQLRPRESACRPSRQLSASRRSSRSSRSTTRSSCSRRSRASPGSCRRSSARCHDAGARRCSETTLSQPSLESLFISLTGRELRE